MATELKLFAFVIGLNMSCFSVPYSSTETVDDLKDRIFSKIKNKIAGIAAPQLALYRVNLKTSKDLAQRATQELARLKEGGEDVLDPSRKLLRYFDQAYWDAIADDGVVHVLVEKPGDAAQWPLTDGIFNDVISSLVTCRALAPGDFGQLALALENNRIVDRTNRELELIRNIETRLSQVRFYKPEDCASVSCITEYIGHDNFFSPLPHSLGNPDPLTIASRVELYEYIAICEHAKHLQSLMKTYQANKQAYVSSVLMKSASVIQLALGEAATYKFGGPWEFFLMCSVETPLDMRRYEPRSDFHFDLDGLPYVILEVCSDASQEKDKTRMLVQAACLVRLGNHLATDCSFVVMAIYVGADLKATRYMLYQLVGASEVYYTQSVCNLATPQGTVDFLIKLYNYAAVAKVMHNKLSSVRTKLMKLKNEIQAKKLKGFTTENPKKRKQPDEPDEPATDTHTQGGAMEDADSLSLSFDNPSVLTPIINAGYSLYDDEIDHWEPMNPLTGMLSRGLTRSGVHVAFKLVEKDTDELSILQHLQPKVNSRNHVIPLLGVVPVYLGSCMIMPYAQPLPLYPRTEYPLALISQFLKGVSFIHNHKIAHLDLKPENVVITERGGQPWLYIIDFGVAVHATLETTIDGFVGTPLWVAPEIGSKDGPVQRYSPIRADRWATGRMLEYFALRHPDFDYSMVLAFAEKLMSREPLQRPSLEDHCWCKRRKKRTARTERPNNMKICNDKRIVHATSGHDSHSIA